MDQDYDLKPIDIGSGLRCYELISCPNGKSHIEEWSRDPKKKQTLSKLLLQLRKIKQYGIPHSVQADKLTPIDGSVGLYEIKGYDGVNREMSVCACQTGNELEIVLLFPFRGHQGTDKIKKSEMEKGKKLSRIARELLENEVLK